MSTYDPFAKFTQAVEAAAAKPDRFSEDDLISEAKSKFSILFNGLIKLDNIVKNRFPDCEVGFHFKTADWFEASVDGAVYFTTTKPDVDGFKHIHQFTINGNHIKFDTLLLEPTTKSFESEWSSENQNDILAVLSYDFSELLLRSRRPD